MKAAEKIFENLLLTLAAGSFLAGAAITVLDVVLRGVWSSYVPAAIELTSLLIGLGALLSMPVCYANRSHVCAKLLSEVNPARFTKPLGILGAVASLIFATLLLWVMLAYTIGKIGSPETTRDLALKMTMLLWITCAALGLAWLCALVGLWRQITGNEA